MKDASNCTPALTD